jgi:hypothetical protein
MFVAAGGLVKLTKLCEQFSHQIRPALTPLILEVMHTIFASRLSTPKSCFARILARAGFLEMLSRRYVVVAPTDPVLTLICSLFEMFSTGEATVKWPLANPEFIGLLFARAKRGARPGLNEVASISVFNTVRNLAMERSLVDLLLEGELLKYLGEYLQPPLEFTPIVEKCFSALFYLSRGVRPITAWKLTPFVPTVIQFLSREPPIRDFAVTMLLECVSAYADEMKDALIESNAVEALFGLLRSEEMKQHVIAAIAQWAQTEPQMLEAAVLQRIDLFTDVLTHYFRTEPVNMFVPVAKSLLSLCDRCPLLTRTLSDKPLVKVMIQVLLEQAEVAQLPEVRVEFSSLIIALYEATPAPKLMIAKFKVLAAAKKLVQDDSAAVRGLGQKLLQAIASNYIL